MSDIDMEDYQSYDDTFVYKTEQQHGEHMPRGDREKGAEGKGRVEQEEKGEST